MAQIEFVATCTRGAEQVLVAELSAIGIERISADRGAVRFWGSLELGYRACLWSRIASRVLLVLAHFPAADADALYQGVAAVDWPNHLPWRRTFRVNFVGVNRAIRNTRFGAQVTKDAVVAQYDRGAPRVDVKQPDLRIHLHLRKEQGQVSIDLSGDPLHLRTVDGKRGAAPLRENLAATLLHIAGWPKLAAEGAPLVDPMCGSGTFLAEAAGIARSVAPGLSRRSWGFMAWGGHQSALWQAELEQARAKKRAGAANAICIRGADKSDEQVRRARHNLIAMGMKDVVVEVISLGDQQPPVGPPGLMVVNPPYGERLGGEQDLVPLYRELGDVLRRRFMGWTGWVLASDRRLASAVGLRPASRFPIHNGPIECRWLSFPIRQERVARDR
jgi:23S rRNA (guanine2445-N2)-methyltransferase / 23S rRNA (guanine2069-N7)-methyltransferase